MKIIDHGTALDGTGLRVGIVAARFNEAVCEELLDACIDELMRLGVSEDDVIVVRVPGALEIPLALETLAEHTEVDSLVALGAVIRGETYHFELVANQSGSGITTVQLEIGIPIANGVLTTESDEQAEARAQDKGVDCARVAIEMVQVIRAIRGGS